jgi:hypothetical protein
MKLSRIFLIVPIFLFVANAHAQDCQVLLASVSGKYTGGCKQGKADGNGRAEGIDMYVGQFKAGLPEGKGTYTWKSGDVFKGEWVKGVREGQGSMAFKRAGKSDSVVNGMWKNDTYAGAYVKPEKPYTILQKSNYFSRSDFRKNVNSKENSIELTITSASAGTSRVGMIATYAPATISNIAISTGSYGMITDGVATSRGTTKKLTDVTYPFRATLTVGGQELEFEITDPGAWSVTMAINQ